MKKTIITLTMFAFAFGSFAGIGADNNNFRKQLGRKLAAKGPDMKSKKQVVADIAVIMLPDGSIKVLEVSTDDFYTEEKIREYLEGFKFKNAGAPGRYEARLKINPE